MAATTTGRASLAEGTALATDYLQPRWYAVQTCANHEKRVSQQLCQRTVEAYLPLYESMRQWKDRRMRLELPLFPGYVFVRDRKSVV